MGREVRRVPATWEHPKDRGDYRPLHAGNYAEQAREFMERANRDGLQEAVDYMNCPNRDDYMPEWTDAERTHWQMYETCTEGTPLSPVMESPEALARWLADNGASSFGSMTASYDDWLATIQRGFAFSAVFTPSTGLVSGVEGLARIDAERTS